MAIVCGWRRVAFGKKFAGTIGYCGRLRTAASCAPFGKRAGSARGRKQVKCRLRSATSRIVRTVAEGRPRTVPDCARSSARSGTTSCNGRRAIRAMPSGVAFAGLPRCGWSPSAPGEACSRAPATFASSTWPSAPSAARCAICARSWRTSGRRLAARAPSVFRRSGYCWSGRAMAGDFEQVYGEVVSEHALMSATDLLLGKLLAEQLIADHPDADVGVRLMQAQPPEEPERSPRHYRCVDLAALLDGYGPGHVLTSLERQVLCGEICEIISDVILPRELFEPIYGPAARPATAKEPAPANVVSIWREKSSG